MQAQTLTREFKYNSVKLADPSPAFTLQQVRDFFANIYPEIINADIEGPETVGDRQIFTFRRAVGTKGGAASLPEPQKMVKDLAALEQIGWFHSERRAAKLIRKTAELMAGHDTFVLDDFHQQALSQLHAVHCSRTVGAAA